jgi:hypothetical protein
MRNLVFGFAVLMLVASLIPACGGDGGSGSAGAVPPSAPATEFVVHESTQTGPHTVPALSTTGYGALLRELVFTPAVGEELIRIEVQGTATFAPAAGRLYIVVLDHNYMLVDAVAVQGNWGTTCGYLLKSETPGSNVSTQLSTAVTWPAPYYRIRFFATNSANAAAYVQSAKFRILTVKNGTVIPASGQISG